MNRTFEFIISDAGLERIDIFLSHKLKDLSRSYIKQLINEEYILVNSCPVKPSYILKNTDILSGAIPVPKPLTLEKQNISLSILYEDSHIIVVNKPVGMVVHPATGNFTDTLVNALLYHCKDLSSINGILRPGIVHRLDKNTSGVVVVAKNDLSHRHLAYQFAKRKVVKEYLGIVHGRIRPGTIHRIDLPIARHPVHRKKMAVVLDRGKPAETEFSILALWEDLSYIRIRLLTGRTHQIRVHMAHIGYPIAGDDLYRRKHLNRLSPTLNINRQLLHAYHLHIIHPVTHKDMDFYAPIPSDIQYILNIKGYTT